MSCDGQPLTRGGAGERDDLSLSPAPPGLGGGDVGHFRLGKGGPGPEFPHLFHENPESETSINAPEYLFFPNLASVHKFWRIPLPG